MKRISCCALLLTSFLVVSSIASARVDVAPLPAEVKAKFSKQGDDPFKDLADESKSILAGFRVSQYAPQAGINSLISAVSQDSLEEQVASIDAFLDKVHSVSGEHLAASLSVSEVGPGATSNHKAEFLGKVRDRATKLRSLAMGVMSANNPQEKQMATLQLRNYLDSIEPEKPEIAVSNYELQPYGRAGDQINLPSKAREFTDNYDFTEPLRNEEHQSRLDATEASAAPSRPTMFSDVNGCYVNEQERDDNLYSDTVTSGVHAFNSDDLNRVFERIRASGEEPSLLSVLSWLHNNYKMELGYGIRRGAEHLLDHEAVTNAEMAVLVTSILREMGLPARTKRVTAKVANRQADLNWFGVRSLKAAQHMIRLISDEVSGDFRVMPEIQNPGPGGEVTADSYIEFPHIIVSACIPYTNYRGSTNDETGFRWIDLDLTYKVFDDNNPGITAIEFDFDDWFSKFTHLMAEEAYESQIRNSYIQHANATGDFSQLNMLASYSGPMIKQVKLDVVPVIQYEYEDRRGGEFRFEDNDPYILWQHTQRIGNPGSANPNYLSLRLEPIYNPVYGEEGGSQGILFSSSSQAWRDWLDGNRTLSCQHSDVRNMTVTLPFLSPTELPACRDSNNFETHYFLFTKLFNTHDGSTFTPSGIYAYANITETIQLLVDVGRPTDEDLNTWVELSILDIPSTQDLWFLRLAGEKYIRYVHDSAKKIGNYRDSEVFGPSGVLTTKMEGMYGFILGLPYAVNGKRHVIDAYFKQTVINRNTGEDDKQGFDLITASASLYESYIWQENTNLQAVSTVVGLQYVNDHDDNNHLVKLTRDEVLALDNATKSDDKIRVCDGDDPYAEGEICYKKRNVQNSLVSRFQQAESDSVLYIPYKPISFYGWDGSTYAAFLNLSDDPEDPYYITTMAIGQYNGGFSCATGEPAVFNSTVDTSDPNFNYHEYQTNGYEYDELASYEGYDRYEVGHTVNSTINSGNSYNSTWDGDPVNMVTGNLLHEEVDFSFPSSYIPFEFKRTYNSANSDIDGPLGYGWTHTYNQTLEILGDVSGGTGTITGFLWVDGNGSKRLFELEEPIEYSTDDPEYEVPSDAAKVNGQYVSLYKNFAHYDLVIREKNNVEYHFRHTDHTRAPQVGDKVPLLRIHKLHDNFLFMSRGYEDRLHHVYDKMGRRMVFTYQDDKIYEIKFVNHSDPGAWTEDVYTYNYDLEGQLESVDDPAYKSGERLIKSSYKYTSKNNYSNLLEDLTVKGGKRVKFDYFYNGKVRLHHTYHTSESNEDAVWGTRYFYYNGFRREALSIDERGQTTEYHFNEHGLPIRIKKPDGGFEDYEYKDSRNPFLRTATENSYGVRVETEYDDNGNILKQLLPSGATIEYSHYKQCIGEYKSQLRKDANDNYTLSLYDNRCNTTDYVRFKKGVGGSIDPATVNITDYANQILTWERYEYPVTNWVDCMLCSKPILIRQVEDFSDPESGPYQTYDYSNYIGWGPLDDGVSYTVTYHGDINGDGVIGDGEGLGTYTHEFDGHIRPTKTFDESLYPIDIRYDVSGHVISETDVMGHKRKYQYDPQTGRLSSEMLKVIDSEGSKLVDYIGYKRNKRGGYLETQSNRQGVPVSYEYDQMGNTTRTIAADGYWIGYEYDSVGRLVKTFDEEGHTYEKRFDQMGRLVENIAPNGLKEEYFYYGPEQEGRLKSVKGVDGRLKTFTYDDLGLVTRVTETGWEQLPTDPPAQETYTYYDAASRPTYIVTAAYQDEVLGRVQAVTHYQYDSLGNLTHTYAGWVDEGNDPESASLFLQETLKYDHFGRVLEKQDALQNKWTYKYDVHGNVKEIHEPEDRVLEFDYYYGGLLKERKVQGGSDFVLIERNELGQVTAVTTPDIVYEYFYDEGNRLQYVVDKRDNKEVEYHYDITGQLVQVDDPDQGSIHYLRDPSRRLTGIRTHDLRTINYVRDEAGRVIQERFPNKIFTEYKFKENTNLIEKIQTNKVTANVGSVFRPVHISEYEYEAGLLTNETTTAADLNQTTGTYEPISTDFSYDSLGRLLSATNSNRTVTASYDPFGNRRTFSETGQPTEHYNHNAMHQIDTIRSGSSTGPVIADFDYDDFGQLVTKTEGSTVTSMRYDAWGRMTEASKSGLSIETYKYDHLDRRIEKVIGGEATRFVYDGPHILAEYDESWNQGKRYAYGLSVDDPVASISGQNIEYYHQDRMGSVVAITDNYTHFDSHSGKVTATAVYDPWGNITQSEGSMSRFGFTSREHDDTGFIFNRARYYDPTVGRFNAADALGFVDGVNRYAYAMNSPTRYIDPWGYSASAATYTSSSSVQSTLGAVARFAVEQLPFGEAATKIVIDGDFDGALESAAIEATFLAVGVATGGAGYVAYKAGRLANSTRKLASKFNCSFDESTLVSTPNGFRAIGLLAVGDLVLSKDPVTGEVVAKPVIGKFSELHAGAVNITVQAQGQEELISTTIEHPFYVDGEGWVQAGDLKSGDKLLSLQDASITIVEVNYNPGEFEAFNLHVDDYHTYAVGGSKAWVHNACDITKKVNTPHTVAHGGNKTAGAPKTNQPNSIHEQVRPDGSRSVTYYDDKGRMFSREDYGQQRTHGVLGRGSDNRSVPHEHRINWSDRGPTGKQYRELDNSGRPVGPWYDD